MALSLDAALSGLLQQQRKIELIANNVTNVNTTGYKRADVHFQDVLDTVEILEVLRGERIIGDATVPAGVAGDAIERVFAQGPLQPTGIQLDLAIVGDGMFRVVLEDDGVGYTRDGSFVLDESGAIVTVDGLKLDPPLTLPLGWRQLELAADGAVTVLRPYTAGELAALPPDGIGDGVREAVGQLTLTRFSDPKGLVSIGASLYVGTAESGPPIDGAPGADGMGVVHNGFLEGSNVDMATEMSSLILASRAYQLNLAAYQSVEEMLSNANQLA